MPELEQAAREGPGLDTRSHVGVLRMIQLRAVLGEGSPISASSNKILLIYKHNGGLDVRPAPPALLR
jgi:hypothetical protein